MHRKSILKGKFFKAAKTKPTTKARKLENAKKGISDRIYRIDTIFNLWL